MKPGIDDELDRMKRSYDGLDALLTEVSKILAHHVPQSSAILNIIYFPQLGFLIACSIGSDAGSSTCDGDYVNGWDRVFTNGDTGYYKSPEMNEMDQKFGDLYSMICDREIEILHGLAQSLLQYDDILLAVSEISGDLDCLLALAQGARQYDLVRPIVTPQNVVKITGGRHILQEMTVGSFVANDTVLVGGIGNSDVEIDELEPSSESTQMGEGASRSGQTSTDGSEFPEGPSLLVMTGPNYSGKSVYLKQVALIVYMAHVGSFVPAETATIGLTDKILTRISTRESVSKMQSAFMIDLQQISFALNTMTNRSLLIIDEFGKGTDSKGMHSNVPPHPTADCNLDGAGLACGVLEYLTGLDHMCPKIVAATHFHGTCKRRLSFDGS